MKIFISPLAKPDWAVDKDVFIQALKTNWKEVIINKLKMKAENILLLGL